MELDNLLQPHPHLRETASARSTLLKAEAAGVHFPGSILGRFLELRGRRMARACGTLWYEVPGRFMMSLPYQRLLNPDPGELREMLSSSGALGARFPSVDWSGLDSGMYLMNRQPYDLDNVHIKQRPRVRRGLQRFRIRPATKTELLKQGRELNLSTMRRQGRYDEEFGDARRWQTFVEAVFACTEVSCPAAFVGSRMAAFMITCCEQGWLHILHQMSNQEDLAEFPNHILTFAVTKEALQDESIDSVCYGYMPLFAADGLDEYKQRFGYRLVPHRSAIQLHPRVGSLFNNSFTRGLVRVGRWLAPRNQQFETIENVLQGASRSRPDTRSC
jgi:hypothetical protein